jgi:hypothetical protein
MRMTDDDQSKLHPKDRVPPEEGIVIPADEFDRVNDRTPTADLDPARHERRVPDKRPTDGPL